MLTTGYGHKMGVFIKQINNIKIEKTRVCKGCKKKCADGTIKVLTTRPQTWYQAISPKGKMLYQSTIFKRVKEFARLNKNYTKRQK